MKYFNILVSAAVLLLLSSCGDKKEEIVLVARPEARGTFVDVRDQNEYKWVRYAGIDWMAENMRFNTQNSNSSAVYQSYGWNSEQPMSTANAERYGYLYTLAGARFAAPAGWRLPTDDDWKSLEMALGTSMEQADAREWRGNYAGDLMKHTNMEAELGMQMAGYYTPYTVMATSGYRFMGSYAFFWTDTKDESKDGNFQFYRKLFYNSPKVYRESMESERTMLSVRFVRDAVVQ